MRTGQEVTMRVVSGRFEDRIARMPVPLNDDGDHRTASHPAVTSSGEPAGSPDAGQALWHTDRISQL